MSTNFEEHRTIELSHVKITGLKAAIDKHTGHIPGSVSFIFDGDDKKLLYMTDHHPELAHRILAFNEELDFSERTSQAKNNISQIECFETERVLVFKKLAADLYFGICVEPNEQCVDLATKAMATDLRI